MKKRVVLPMLLSLTLPMQVFANEAEDNTVADAGVTPDEILYFFDTAVESVEEMFAEEGVEKATLLEEHASERLAEIVELNDANDKENVLSTIERYEETLSDLVGELDKAIEAGQSVAEIGEKIEESEAYSEQVLEEALDILTDEQVTDVESDLEEVSSELGETAEVIAILEDDSTEVVPTTEEESLKRQVSAKVIGEVVGQELLDVALENELNDRQILAIHALALTSGKTFEEVLELFNANEQGIGATAKALGLNQKEALKTINAEFKSAKRQIKSQFKVAKQETEQTSTEEETDNEPADSENTSDKDAVNEGEAEAVPTESAEENNEESSAQFNQEVTSVSDVGAKKNVNKPSEKANEKAKKVERTTEKPAKKELKESKKVKTETETVEEEQTEVQAGSSEEEQQGEQKEPKGQKGPKEPKGKKEQKE